MRKPEYWKKALRELSRTDPVMKNIIAQYKGETLYCSATAFHTLARSITGQQISVKAAAAIWSRFETLAGQITPQHILRVDADSLRGIGFSKQKALYLHELAKHFNSYGGKPPSFDAMSDEEIMAQLLQIKGIGKWSVEMFLIFNLLRPDVFPIKDIGIQKAIIRHYNNGRPMTLARMEKLAQRWKPWRTVASWYLWRSIDPAPVAY